MPPIYTVKAALKYCYLDVIRYKYFSFSGRAGRTEYWLFMILMTIPTFMLYGLTLAALVIQAIEAADMAVVMMGETLADYEASGWGGGLSPLILIGFGLMVVWSLFNVIPGLAVTFRRLHDTGRSGWHLLICLIPFVGGVILLIYMLLAGQPFINKYGPPLGD